MHSAICTLVCKLTMTQENGFVMYEYIDSVVIHVYLQGVYLFCRDEDKLILEAMQQSDSFSLNDQELFSLSTRLERRSAPEVCKYFL